MRALCYKAMKPLANFLTRINKKKRKYKEDKIKKKVDSLTIEEVAKRASDLIISELVNYHDEIFITIADRCYKDYCCSILDYIKLETEWDDKVLYRWTCINSKFGHDLELNEKLTNMVENNLRSNSMIEIKHVFIERLKYSYASQNYKETVIFSLGSAIK